MLLGNPDLRTFAFFVKSYALDEVTTIHRQHVIQ